MAENFIAGGVNPLAAMLNPAIDGTMTLKSPANPVEAANTATPATGMSPDMMGLFKALAGMGSTLQGGQNTIGGQLGGNINKLYENALFNQFMQMLSGRQGAQVNPK